MILRNDRASNCSPWTVDKRRMNENSRTFRTEMDASINGNISKIENNTKFNINNIENINKKVINENMSGC